MAGGEVKPYLEPLRMFNPPELHCGCLSCIGVEKMEKKEGRDTIARNIADS